MNNFFEGAGSFLYLLTRLKKKDTSFDEPFLYPLTRLQKKPTLRLTFLYPQAVSNRCCGNENPESWATRR